MSFVHTIYLENGYRFNIPDNDIANIAEKVANYVSKQLRNYFSCFWSDATVLVALLVDHAKGRSPQKGHLWPRNYTMHT